MCFLLPELRQGHGIALSWTGPRVMSYCSGCIVRAWARCCGNHGCMAFACLAGQSSLFLSTCYRQACFMIQHFFLFSEKAGHSNFRGVTQNGCHSCHPVCKKLISGFHISWVDLNNCLKKRKMLWERFVPSHAEHWADPLTWKALFITLPAFPKQLSACPCMLSMFSHPSSLYTSPCRGAEKTGKEKVFRFFLQGLSGGFLCTIMKFCGSDCIHAFAVFLAF